MELTRVELKEIRKKLARQNSIFAQKNYLDGLYLPSHIIGRKKQAKEILSHIESLKQGFMVPVVSVYGRSGSGKSTLVKFVCNDVENLACFVFVNLRKAKTVFGCANRILSEFGISPLKSADGLNKTIDVLGKCITERLESQRKKSMILVLDEYDVIFLDKRNNPSDFIYKLLTLEEELREKDLWLCIVTISNNALSEYSLDDRIKSRMGNSEVFFPSYTKDDIFQILKDRSKKAFTKKIPDDILMYCAQISSSEHGDARRALDLLRVAGEICDGTKITKDDINVARNKLQKDRLELILASLSLHQRIVMGAICDNLYGGNTGWTSTSEIFEIYEHMLNSGTTPKSYRTISNFLVEFKNLGLIYFRTISKGRYGYGNEYRLYFPPWMIGPLIGAKWWEEVIHRTAMLSAIREFHKDKSKHGNDLNSFLKKRRLR